MLGVQQIATAFFAVLITMGSATAAKDIKSKKNPNIIILYADDFGYGDPQCYNPNSKIPTPTLDKLASEGVRFTDGHSSSGICTPSRYALLTGRYHWRDFHSIANVFDPSMFKHKQLSIAEMLKTKGYHTAAIGKWHLGWDWNAIKKPGVGHKKIYTSNDFDWSRPILGGPLSHGFDYYFGDDVINFPPYGWIKNDKLVKAPNSMSNPKKWKKIKEGAWECRPGPMCADWDPYQNLPTITRKAVEYINTQKDNPHPFFLYLAFPSTHAPIIPSDKFDNTSKAGPYGDYAVQMDDACHQVLTALKNIGKENNTIVIFSTDNGSEHYAYLRDLKYNHWSSFPFRGVKRDIYEGGHHVPLIIKWPGQIKPGRVSNALVCQVDIMATLAHITGAQLPTEHAAEDSFDMLPLLLGKTDTLRTSLVHNTFKNKYAIRYKQWVLINSKSGYSSKCHPKWTKKHHYAPDDKQAVELYNLNSDIGQHYNVANEHPEVVKHLQSILKNIREIPHSSPRYNPPPQ